MERTNAGILGAMKSLMMSSIAKVNSTKRGIVEYNPARIDSLFDPTRDVKNTLVSGGNYRLRTSAMVAQTCIAASKDLPVILIHEGNRFLEQQLSQSLRGLGRYYEVSSNSPCFEPFYGLTELEIANQIIETAPTDYKIQYNARYYIEAVGAYLRARGKAASFKMLAACPHATMFDRIDELERRRVISASAAQEIKSKLMMGQSESFKIDTFLASLRHEAGRLMFEKGKGQRPLSILSTLKSGCVLSFDLMAVTNTLLVNTVVHQLKLAQTHGIAYLMVIDSIPMNANGSLRTFIRGLSDAVPRLIVADDIYAMTGGDDGMFSALVGNSQVLIVLNHVSGASAVKWADVFGHYDRIEETISISHGSSKRMFSLFPIRSSNRTVSTQHKREYVVKPEEITRLTDGEAFVRADGFGQLCHLSFIY